MNYSESIPIAKQLAENQLKKGFDVEAFIILTLLNDKQSKCIVDKVPESQVDEIIESISSLFITYSKNRNVANLQTMLNNIVRFITELYLECKTKEEKLLFNDFKNKLEKSLQTTIIE